MRREFDLQHARLGRREHGQLIEIGVEHAIFGRELRRIARDAERDADARQQRPMPLASGSNSGLPCRSSDLIARRATSREVSELDLALHAFGVRRRRGVGALALVDAGEIAVLILQQDARLGRVARLDDIDEGRAHQGQRASGRSRSAMADDRAPDLRQIDLARRSSAPSSSRIAAPIVNSHASRRLIRDLWFRGG